MHSVSPPPSIARLLARNGDQARVVAALHQAALDRTGATSSVLLCPDAATGHWRAASAAGLETLALGPWLVTSSGTDAAGRALSADHPITIASLRTDLPELAELLLAPSCVLAPVTGIQPIGLLVLAVPAGHVPNPEAVALVADAMAIALDRGRAADELALHREVRELMAAFARVGASPTTVAPALLAMCRGVGRLTSADVVEVWQHDRRARALVLAATSDPQRGTSRPAIATADRHDPLAMSLRRDRPELTSQPAADSLGTNVGLVVPLRGRRRALGVLAVQGVRLEPGGEGALLERAAEIGRQLSALLENVQLLDDVLRSRAQLENVFNSLADLVAVTDAADRIVDVNRAFAEWVGQPREALIDQALDQWLSPALIAWIQAARDADPTPSGTRGQVVDPPEGTFDLTLTPLGGVDAAPAGHVLVARDVTVETRLEAERASLEHRLGQSEKLLALAQFVAGIAHELNNPLQGVLGHLELVRTAHTLSAPLRRDLRLVYREAERAARIVRNLLVFAGSGRLTRRSLNVTTVVARVLQLRSAAHRIAQIEISRDLGEGLPRVKGDSLLLQQAVLNLILNAEQAMAGRGRLTISTRAAEGGHVRIVVEDSGPGLSREVRARLFEPFFTTKEVGAGTGLGLAITYGIVKAHGGTIEAVNGDQGGARFTISLKAEG